MALTGHSKFFEMEHEPTRGLYACNAYRPWDTPERICIVFENISERKQALEQIRQLVNEQRTILDTVMAGICHIKDRKVQWVNPCFEKLFGYEAGEVQGVDTSLFYSDEEDYRRVGRDGYTQLTMGAAYSIEVLMRRKDGTLFWCSLAERAIDPQNQDEGSIWVLHDVTERRRTEEALYNSERKLTEIFRASPQIIAVSTVEDGRFLEANEAFSRLLGYRHEEVIGHTSLELGLWSDNEDRDRLVEFLKTHGQVQNLETRLRRKSGECIDVLLSAAPIVLNGQSCMITLTTDITERKRAADELRESEERFSAVATQAKDGIVLIQDDRLVFCNQAIADMLGYAREEMEGEPFEIHVAPESRELVAGRVHARLRGENPVSVYEARLIRRDGQIIDVELSAGLIQHGGKPTDVGMIRDITERKQAEAALRASEERFKRLVQNSNDIIALVDAHCMQMSLRVPSKQCSAKNRRN